VTGAKGSGPARTGVERRAEILDRLLPVVRRELARGVTFSDISIETLTRESGVARSTFYSHFADKAELLRACADGVAAETEASAERWFRLGDALSLSELREALGDAVRRYVRDAPLMAAVYDGARSDAGLRQLVTGIVGGLADRLADHIAEEQRLGRVDQSLHPRETAAVITWMYERTQHQALLFAEGEALDRLIDAGATVTWRALYAPAQGG